MSSGRALITPLISGLIKRIDYKRILCKVSSYFTTPYGHSSRNIKVEFDLSNYATETDLRETTGVDKTDLAEKSNLVSLKAEWDKVGIDKLKNVPKSSSR